MIDRIRSFLRSLLPLPERRVTGWARVSQFGHIQHEGYVETVRIAGHGALSLRKPDGETILIPMRAVFSVVPLNEADVAGTPAHLVALSERIVDYMEPGTVYRVDDLPFSVCRGCSLDFTEKAIDRHLLGLEVVEVEREFGHRRIRLSGGSNVTPEPPAERDPDEDVDSRPGPDSEDGFPA